MLFFIPSLRGQIPRSPAEEEAGLAVHDPRAKLSPSNQGDLNFFCLCFFLSPPPSEAQPQLASTRRCNYF